MATGDVIFLALSFLGVFVYLVVALAGVILTMACYAQQRSRLHWLRELLLVVIAVLHLYGLIAINTGVNNLSIWAVNRLMWLGFGVVSLVLAARAFLEWVSQFLDDLTTRGIEHE